MTCKDCIHERVCWALIKDGLPYMDEDHPAEAFCMTFRNKSDVCGLVYGKWITNSNGLYRCSLCGYDALYHYVGYYSPDVCQKLTSICPHCGARMTNGGI